MIDVLSFMRVKQASYECSALLALHTKPMMRIVSSDGRNDVYLARQLTVLSPNRATAEDILGQH